MHRWLALLPLTACGPIGATQPSTTPTPPTLTTTTTPTVPPLGHDTFVQAAHAKVDVLLVVQDTAGMGPTQADAAANLPFFFDYLLGSGIDWHVGFVTTDCDDPDRSGKLVSSDGLRWADSDTANPVEVLAGIEIGVSGSATVQALGAAWLALEVERDLANAGFTRDDAALHVVVIGDGTDATDPALIEADAFVAWLEALKAEPDASFSCVLSEGAVATACADVAAEVGGVVGEVGPEVLGAVGLETTGLERTFPLSKLPVAGTLEVSVEDTSGAVLMFTEGTDYTYDAAANAITFVEYIPSGGATIVVDYTPAS